VPKETATIPETFFPVPLEMLEPGKLLPCNVWLRRGEAEPVLYRSENLFLGLEHVQRLRASGLKSVLIAFEDAICWSDFVGQQLKQRVLDKAVPIEKRVKVLTDTAHVMMEEIFDNPLAPGVKRKVEHLGDAVAQVIQEPEAFSGAVRLMEHDYYTYSHCFHVSVFAVALARAAGIDDQSYITSLGRGGLIHDIGKTALPPSLINKRQRLTPAEFDLMKNHPLQGVKILEQLGWRDPVVQDTTMNHHERLDGTGYHRGLEGEAISVAARITAICDAFDAMTTDRAYSAAMTPVEALKVLRVRGAEAYDQRLLRVFIRLLLDPGSAS